MIFYIRTGFIKYLLGSDIMNFQKELARNFRRIRLNKGLTIEEVCDASDLNYRTVSGFENAKKNTSLENICKMVNGLGISIDFSFIEETIANKLIDFRTEKGLSMSQLGKLTNCAHTTISDYENMKGNIRIETLMDISKGLAIDVRDIYPFTELDLKVLDITKYEVEYNGPTFDEKYLGLPFDEFINTGQCAAREAKIYSVVDGDTLRVDLKENSRLRLLAIDTPETIKNAGKWGVLARDYMKHLTSISDRIIIQEDIESRNRDGYGRGLYWVWLKIDNQYRLLNYMMINAGFAVVDHIDGKRLYLNELKQAQEDAKKNKRIMWGYKYLDPYFDYVTNKPRKRYWSVLCDGEYEVFSNDYYIKDLSFVTIGEGTKFKSKKDALTAKRRARFYEQHKAIEIELKYEGGGILQDGEK